MKTFKIYKFLQFKMYKMIIKAIFKIMIFKMIWILVRFYVILIIIKKFKLISTGKNPQIINLQVLLNKHTKI